MTSKEIHRLLDTMVVTNTQPDKLILIANTPNKTYDVLKAETKDKVSEARNFLYDNEKSPSVLNYEIALM